MNKINGRPMTKAQARLAVEEDTPKDCGHEKQPVEIEYFPGGADGLDEKKFRAGYFCPTCRRVTPRMEA